MRSLEGYNDFNSWHSAQKDQGRPCLGEGMTKGRRGKCPALRVGQKDRQALASLVHGD